jgi:tellurite resistance protein
MYNEIEKNERINVLLNIIFFQEEKKMIESRKKIKKMKNTVESLSKISGIKNEAVLKKLIELGVQPEIMTTLSLVPFIEVAWADGEVQKEEREAILRFVKTAGFIKGASHDVLEQWLSRHPDPNLFDAWKNYMQGLCEQMTSKERSDLQQDIISHAKIVAEASGGFLGVGKISSKEKEVLEKLEKVFII